MQRLPTRADKLALLTKIVSGALTQKDINDLRKSREPIRITLNIGDERTPKRTNDPTCHTELSADWKVIRRYNQYADGRIEELE